MNIPNIITVGRVFMVPVVVWLIITQRMEFAFLLFVLAGISDGVDGYIAKRFGQETVLGAYLDPLADKALLVSIYVALGIQNEIPDWLVIMVVTRDILIVSAVVLSWIMERAVSMAPLFISKVNTTGQIVLAALVLADVGYGWDLGPEVRSLLVFIVAALTVFSALAYLLSWLDHMARYESEQARRPARSRPKAVEPRTGAAAQPTSKPTAKPTHKPTAEAPRRGDSSKMRSGAGKS